jgi:hypothetical protein
MGFAEDVLALHEDIYEVFILEERSGGHIVVGEASRKGVTLLGDSIESSRSMGVLAPMIILGSASQFGGQQSRLLGIEYEKGGVVLVPFGEDRVLALSTKLESLSDVMRTVSAALPRLKERAYEIPMEAGAVTSAAQAENEARRFLAGRFPDGSAPILVNEVSYRNVDQRWEVHGSYKSRIWGLSKRFQVEVDANDGFVKKFTYSSSSFLLLVEIVGVVAAVLLAFLAFFRGL